MLQRLLSMLYILLLSTTSWAGGTQADFTVLVEQAARAVVNISTTQRVSSEEARILPDLNDIPPELGDFLDRFFDHPRMNPHKNQEPRTHGLGSGFIISTDGYILTAAHVVKNADEIMVRDATHHEWTAKVVGVDSLIDVALLKVNGRNFSVARLGNSDALKVGQWVLAIGQPFGLDYTATAGIVSALGRNLPNDTYVPFIQTDVAVNPGNSGGPLYGMDGAVVGINAQIYTPSGGYAGLSFAIPITVAMDSVEQIKSHGQVIRGWLGVTVQRVSQDLASSFGLERPRGALVSTIDPKGPSHDTNLRVGDIVVAYDGHPIETASDLPHLVGRSRPGAKVPVTIIRNGQEQTLTLTVDELPQKTTYVSKSAKPGTPKQTPNPDPPPLLGLSITNLPFEKRDGIHGVLVKRVENGPARVAGIRSHDIIVRMGGIAIRDAKHFRGLVPKLPRSRTIPILILREGNPMFLALRIP